MMGAQLAVKLQYPDMQSAVEADLKQLNMLFSIHRRMRPAIETSEMMQEIAARLREELDYALEASHMRLYGLIFAGDPLIRVPEVLPELSTQRLLTMNWLEGRRLLDYTSRPLEERNQIARAMFRAWWFPFSHYGVIHGDPHLGNYTVFEDEEGRAAGINLLDYGCMRSFAPKFVQGVVDLYRGLLTHDRALIVHAYETWGFGGLSNELIDILNIWAKFIYGPMLEDRARTIADEMSPGMYGRREAFKVHQGLRDKGPVKVPREFVFMDRAAIGLGGVFLHLGAELNFHRLFDDTIAGVDLADVTRRQREAFTAARGAAARGFELRDPTRSTNPRIARDAGFVVSRRPEQRANEHKGNGMRIDPAEGHPAMDYSEHQRTYKLFPSWHSTRSPASIVIMALLAMFVV